MNFLHKDFQVTEENKDAVAKELERLSKEYYAGDCEVKDEDFDLLYRKLREGFPEHSYFKNVNQGPKEGRLLKHLIPMQSIRTEVDGSFEALVAFDAQVKDLLKTENKIQYIIELKYDGLGLNLRYERGHLTSISTRGDGFEGEDVTHCLPLFKDAIPTFIEGLIGVVEIRGEAVMLQEEFKRVNEVLASENKKTFVNPRNAAAGVVRTKKKRIPEDIQLVFFPYCFGGGEIPEDLDAQNKVLEFFTKHFESPKNRLVNPKTFTHDLGYHYSVFEAIEKSRGKLGFGIDGVVYKVNDFNLQKELGYRSSEPRWAIAQKYKPETRETLLESIDIQVGRTGKLTPVARISPVFVGGTTVSNVTLHNIFNIRERNVRVGDRITIQRAGDTIPEIAYQPKSFNRRYYTPNFRMPRVCPCCGEEVRRLKGDRDYHCFNYDCPERVVGRLVHFVERKAMNIIGLGEETIIKLVERGRVKDWLDLYHLDVNILDIDGGLGKLNAEKVYREIQKSKVIPFRQFIYALGISNVGIGTASRLEAVVKPEELPYKGKELLNIKDIGEFTVDSIEDYFLFQDNLSNYEQFVLHMEGVELLMPKKESEKLLGKTIAFTGSFKSLKRDEFENLVKLNSGKVGSSVGPKTSMFVVGSSPTKHKVEKAKELGVQMLSEEEFLDLLK